MKNAYFTLEATFVLPIVISILLSFVYFSAYVYDRCLWEQDLEMFVIYTSTVETDSDMETLMTEKLSEMYMDKYVFWNKEELQASLNANKVSVSGVGSIRYLFPNWNVLGIGQWSADVYREASRLSPVQVIRLREHIMGGE